MDRGVFFRGGQICRHRSSSREAFTDIPLVIRFSVTSPDVERLVNFSGGRTSLRWHAIFSQASYKIYTGNSMAKGLK